MRWKWKLMGASVRIHPAGSRSEVSVNASPGIRPDEPSQAGGVHRALAILLLLLLGGGLSLVLYLHGSGWWVAPLAVLGVVLAHLAVFGGAAFVVTRFVRGRFHGGTGHPHQGGSLLLHKPRQYDWLVGLITLGREGKLRRWMLDLAGLQPGNAVLDVGCGTGTLLLAAAERIGKAGTLRGVEPSEEMRARAARKAEERGIPIEVVEASADGLPYPPASFDAVFCTLVLHHLPPEIRESAIREIRRVLRPGGRAVVVDWQNPKSVLGAIASGFLLVHILHSLGPSSVTLDTPGLEQFLKDLGFSEVARSSFGGSVIGAVVSRLGSSTSVMPEGA
jgi:ubiquinone/menaquinone biosynthesis C-methylase UbiE